MTTKFSDTLLDGDYVMEMEQCQPDEDAWVSDESAQETFLPNPSGSISTESLRMRGESKEIKSKTCRNCLFWKKTMMNEFEGECTADSTVAVTLDRTDACFTCDSFEPNG